MKGMEYSLVIIVSAVVLFIVAVVLITIFSQGISPVVSILEMENICRQQFVISCTATGSEPPDWNVPKKVRGNDNFVCSSTGLKCENGKVI